MMHELCNGAWQPTWPSPKFLSSSSKSPFGLQKPQIAIAPTKSPKTPTPVLSSKKSDTRESHPPQQSRGFRSPSLLLASVST